MGEHEDAQHAAVNALFHQLEAALAGHPEATAMEALLFSLVTAIGVSAPSSARAEAMIRALPDLLIPLLRCNWLEYRAHRAKTAGTTPPGHA
jgi:hypothetical protein